MDMTTNLSRSALSGTVYDQFFTPHRRSDAASGGQTTWTTATKCEAFVFNLIVFLPLTRFQTMQIPIKRAIKEDVATHADVLSSSPAFAELFSTVMRPHLLSATDIPTVRWSLFVAGSPRLTRYL